jgi:hypothetical protein
MVIDQPPKILKTICIVTGDTVRLKEWEMFTFDSTKRVCNLQWSLVKFTTLCSRNNVRKNNPLKGISNPKDRKKPHFKVV